MVIFKDKRGKIEERIISFIPDKNYLKRHNGDISHNKINKLDKDFDGYLIYKKWDGTVVNRLRVINGKTKSLSQKRTIKQPVSLNKNTLASVGNAVSARYGYEGEPGCEDWYLVTWETYCYFEGDVPYDCEDIIISTEWDYTLCPDDEPTDDCSDPENFNNPDCMPGEGYDPEDIDWGPAGIFDHSNEEITPEENSASSMTKFVNAAIYSAGPTVKFRTYEKIVLEKPLAPLGHWRFESITYLSMAVEGSFENMTIEPIVNYTNGTVNNYLSNTNNERYQNSSARMQYSFKEKRTIMKDGNTFTKTSEDITGVTVWSLARLGIGPNE